MKKKCERNVIVVIHFDVHSPSVSADFDVVRADFRSSLFRGTSTNITNNDLLCILGRCGSSCPILC